MPIRPPALSVSEMHRRYGFSAGTCSDCLSLRELRKRHAVCMAAVPENVWYQRKYRWDRLWPACGMKRGRG